MFENSNETEKKLDWMYKGPGGTVDREEYLLGRTVDKSLDQLNEAEKEIKQPKNHVEHECIPPSIRDFKDLTSSEQVDLQQKLQEDPLFAIKKREEETRRKLLENPVQLKKLQEALKSKHKKSKHDNDVDSKLAEKYSKLKGFIEIDDLKKRENLDEILLEKFKAIKKRLGGNIDQILNMDTSSESSDVSKKHKRKKKKRSSSEENSKRKHKRKAPSESEEENHTRNRNSKKVKSRSNEKKTSSRRNRRSSSSSSESSEESEGTRRKQLKNNKKSHSRRDLELRKRRKSSSSDSSDEDTKKKTDRKKKKNATAERRPRKDLHRKKNDYGSSSDSSEYNRKDKRNKGRNTEEKKFRQSSSSSSDSTEVKAPPKREESRERARDRRSRDRRLRHEDKQNKSSKDTETRRKKDDIRDRHGSTHVDKTDSRRKRSNSYETHSKYSKSRNETENKKDSSSESDSSSSDDKIKPQMNYGLVKADGTKIPLKKLKLEENKPKVVDKKEEYTREKYKPKKLTDEEKERLREEMMNNAKWRDHVRENNIKKYKEEERRETEKQDKNYNPDFMKEQLRKSANSSTVESRIKSNIYNIQKSKGDMNVHFSRRY